MRVSFGISLSHNGLKPASGKLGGLDALEYTHKDTGYDGGKGTLYKLKSGLFISSYNSRRSINKSDEFNSEPSLSFDGNFYYANDGDTDKWYEVLISKGVGGAPNGEHVLIDAFWTGARFVGRYALPIEDAMILVDGKDWDGAEQNRVRTAGFLLVGFVPGGKAMQPVAKIAKSTTAWAVVVKWSNKSVKLKYKLVQGTVDFGDRAKLGRLLGTTLDIEAHHIIPWVKGGQHKVVQDAARAGFHLNMIENGLGLQKYTKLIGEGLHGNHPAYDDFIEFRLNRFIKFNRGYSPEIAARHILETLIPELKTKIINAENSGMNLNSYFRTVVNPSSGVPNY